MQQWLLLQNQEPSELKVTQSGQDVKQCLDAGFSFDIRDTKGWGGGYHQNPGELDQERPGFETEPKLIRPPPNLARVSLRMIFSAVAIQTTVLVATAKALISASKPAFL